MNAVKAEQRIPRGHGNLAILHEAFESAAALCAAIPVGMSICDAEGNVVQFNERAAELWGGPGDPGANLSDSSKYRFFRVDGSPLAECETPVMTVLSTGKPLRDVAFILQRGDGSRTTVLCNANPIRASDGTVAGAMVCLQDASALGAQRLTDTYEHAGIGIAEVDGDGRFLRVNEALGTITGYTRAEQMTRHIFDPNYSDDAARDKLNYRQQVTGGYDRYTMEKRIIRKDGTPIWLSITSTSVCDDDGKFLYSVRVVQDITESKRTEERNKALLAELDHRLKNTLATVQTLAAHTLRDAGVADHIRQAFEKRLIALGRTHEQLMHGRWESADLAVIARQILEPFGAPPRVIIEGKTFKLQPQAAVTIGFVLHELASNAALHGAMTAPGGAVELTWEIKDPRALCIVWRETGGPPVRPPERRGFGSQLLDWGIVQELKGDVNARFEPTGFACRLLIPLAGIAA